MKKIVQSLLLFPISIWSQTQIGSDINGQLPGDNTGFSVAASADGNVVAVGANLNDNSGTDAGCVRIYQKTAGAWIQLGATINGEAAGNQSGYSVSLSSDGSTVAIGATENNNHTGHVRVYKNLSGTWTQQGNDIDGQSYGDRSGWSVALASDGTSVVIGSPYNTNNGNDSGIVKVYKLVGNSWQQIGSEINGWFYDAFGRSVSISADGNVVAVGSPYNSLNGGYSGRVRIYRNIGGVWTQEGTDIRGNNANEISGYSVSLSSDGNTVAVGAIGNGTTVNCGYVKVFRNISGVWTQQGSTINGEATGDSSGRSVSLSGDGTVLAIGANMNAGNGTGSGHVRIFKFVAGTWQQRGIDINGQSAGDNCGMSVALSTDGNTLVVGSPYNATNGTNAGQVRIYDITQLLSSNHFTEDDFALFPNPASQMFTIRLPQDTQLERVRLYNSLGQLLVETSSETIDVSAFSKGIYLVEIITNISKTTKKIIVE